MSQLIKMLLSLKPIVIIQLNDIVIAILAEMY